MREKYTYLIKNIGFFTVGSFVPKILSFFLIPLYTTYLSTADYGTSELLNNTVQLLLPLLTLQLQDAVMRFVLDKNYNKKDVFSTGFKIIILGGIVLSIVLTILKSMSILNIELGFMLFILINYFTGSLYNIFSYFCRGIDKIKTLTVSSILGSFITIGLNLLFLVCFKWGLRGYLIANSVGAFSSVLFIFFKCSVYHYFSKDVSFKKIDKEMISFSIPMIFSALSWWVNNSSDKYILTFFCGVSITGVYAVSYKIPVIVGTVGDVISKAFSISAIRDYDPKDTDGFIGKSYSAISFFMTLCCSALILINIPLAKILFAKNFFSAWIYVPPLLISMLFNELSLSCENIFVAIKNTKIISRTAVLGAVINLGLNFILIPLFGAYGASIATAMSFVIVWALRYKRVKRSIILKNMPKKEFTSYIFITIQMALAYGGMKFIILQLIIFLLILLLYRSEVFQAVRKTKKLFMLKLGA